MKIFLSFGMVAGAASATTLGYTQAKTHHKCGHSSDRLFRTEGSTAAQCYAKCTTTDGCKHFSVNTTPNTLLFSLHGLQSRQVGGPLQLRRLQH